MYAYFMHVLPLTLCMCVILQRVLVASLLSSRDLICSCNILQVAFAGVTCIDALHLLPVLHFPPSEQ